MRKHRATFLLLLAVACDLEPPAEPEGGTTGASSTSDGWTSWVPDPEATTTTGPTEASSSSATTDASGASSESSGGPPPSFDCPPADYEQQCSLVRQDCPEGFRCIPWQSDGIATEPVAAVCTPVAEEPVDHYGSCTIDAAACTDDCRIGAACLPVFEGGPTCLDLCGEDEQCPGDQVCSTCGGCSTAWCVPTCDPLAPDCPETLGSCALDYAFGQNAFQCGGYEPGPLGVGEPCEIEWQCSEGLLCADADDLGPGCLGPYACCTELCDLGGPGTACSDPAHVCVPVFIPGQALPSQEHIGFCALPEAHPCNTPGLCPPPGIDDTYPWCSLDNEEACDAGLFGFGGGCSDGCMCVDQCRSHADCPVPDTGTALPVCSDQGPGTENDRCILPCGNGEVCPDGMTCAPEWGDICMWVTETC